MTHWHASALLGLLLTGRYRPFCAAVYSAPDCRARRGFIALMGRVFRDPDHCRRIALTYHLGRGIHHK